MQVFNIEEGSYVFLTEAVVKRDRNRLFVGASMADEDGVIAIHCGEMNAVFNRHRIGTTEVGAGAGEPVTYSLSPKG